MYNTTNSKFVKHGIGSNSIFLHRPCPDSKPDIDLFPNKSELDSGFEIRKGAEKRLPIPYFHFFAKQALPEIHSRLRDIKNENQQKGNGTLVLIVERETETERRRFGSPNAQKARE